MRPKAKRSASKQSAPKGDWRAFDAFTNAQVLKAARSDPDAQPLSDTQLQRMRRPNPKVVRRALGLSQEQFARQFQIPIGTLRDWEQGRVQPDQAACAYLKVIAGNPELVRQLLEPAA